MHFFVRNSRKAWRAFVAHLARSWRVWTFAFVLAVLAVGAYQYAFSPPADFPTGGMVSIASGSSLQSAAAELADTGIVKHPALLSFVLRALGESDRVQAGTYLFNSPENLFTVAYRLVTGTYGLPPVRITFPEGETARDAAERVHDAFPDISESDFLSLAQPYEGYLFPDTYLFLSSADVATIVQAMRANFDAKAASLLADLQASGRSFSDVVIMASLIEREARTDANKRLVAGILSNRLARGMPLQVDAVFGYIFGRDTYSPSFDDLKVDSPYNTYTHVGLPPGPISNPGLASIEAALNPTQTDYFYYLTGRDGLMHYATTYAGHQANRRNYLD